MARNCIREPRHIPAPKIVGRQPDLFGGPIVTHEVPRRPISNTWGRTLLRYHLADHLADLDGGEQQ